MRLAAVLDYEDGGERLRWLADRLGRTEEVARRRAGRLRVAQIDGDSEGQWS